MNNHSESLVVQIDLGDGTFRDALPVRAIPHVTGWVGDFGVPPLEVAIRLQTNISLHAWEVVAYRLLNGKPVAIQPRQWEMVETQLAGFSKKLHRLYPRDEHHRPSDEGLAVWQSQATEKLPAGVFVWLDEFKAEYFGWYGAKFKTRPNLVIPEFDFTPLLSKQVRKMVLEGCEQATPAEHQSAQNLLDERDQLIADIKRWESKDESKPSEALIKEEKLEILRAKLAEIEGMIRVLRGDYPNSSEISQSLAKSSGLSKMVALENVGDAPTKRKAKKPSIEKVALEYMRTVYKAGHFESAAKFHKHLIKTAGVTGSPFEMGTGSNARKLFCPAASSFYDVGTLGKIWAKIRAD